MIALTLATLRLPAAFPILLALVTLSLALVTIGTADASPSIAKAGGVVVLVFAALGPLHVPRRGLKTGPVGRTTHSEDHFFAK
jgi:succinate-acetate transporter protein